MTDPKEARAHRLDRLLDMALSLDLAEQEGFLSSDIVDADLREELENLLRAVTMRSPLDREVFELANLILAEQSGSPVSSVLERTEKKFGQYRLLRLLGEGGMASVWLAERDSSDFNRKVAIKCIKAGFVTPDGTARFFREQQILAQLRHQNIAQLYDAGISDDGVPFIVMEWIDGIPLSQYCRDERNYKLTEQLSLFRKICSAVAYAHKNLIVHRDIKPGNILIDANGEPKLLDFGIAKLLDERAEPMTRTGTGIFTPEYAAPEQLLNQKITTATDVFGLGGILYELLTGLRARNVSVGPGLRHLQESILAPSQALQIAIKKIKNTSDKNVSTSSEIKRTAILARRQHELRGDLDTIVLKALHTDPDRRYPSAIALSDDIESYLQNKPIIARKDNRSYRVQKFLQRHALALTLGFSMAAFLLATTAVSVYQARRAQEETVRAADEARQAAAVKDFLTDLFLTSASGLPRDKVPSTESLLEDGSEKIMTDFEGAPLIKLDLLLTLGRIQLMLGKHDFAERLFKEALSIAEKNSEKNDERWLNAQVQWSEVLMRVRQKDKEGAEFLWTAIDRYRKNGGLENKTLVSALSNLGMAYLEVDDYDNAVSLKREALAMSRRLFGQDDPVVEDALRRLGETLSEKGGSSKEAEALLREDMNMTRRLYGERHLYYAQALNALSSELGIQRRDVEAERLARQAVGIIKTISPLPKDSLANALNSWGNALLWLGELDDAEKAFRQVHAIDKELTGADSVNAAVSLGNLGEIASDRQDYREEERLFREQLRIYEKSLGSKHSRVALALRGVAHALTAQQKFAVSKQLLTRALEINRAIYGETGVEVGKILADLASVEILADQPSKALESVDRSLSILGNELDPGHPELAEAAITKAVIMDRQERYAEAYDELAPLMKRWSGKGFSMRKTLVRGWKELGSVQNSLGKKSEAIESWNAGLALLRPMKFPPTSEIKTFERLIREASASVH